MECLKMLSFTITEISIMTFILYISVINKHVEKFLNLHRESKQIRSRTLDRLNEKKKFANWRIKALLFYLELAN